MASFIYTLPTTWLAALLTSDQNAEGISSPAVTACLALVFITMFLCILAGGYAENMDQRVDIQPKEPTSTSPHVKRSYSSAFKKLERTLKLTSIFLLVTTLVYLCSACSTAPIQIVLRLPDAPSPTLPPPTALPTLPPIPTVTSPPIYIEPTATPWPTVTPEPTATMVPESSSRITRDMLMNFTYWIEDFNTSVVLQNGSFTNDTLRGQLVEPVAFGDLNSDNLPDAAVILTFNSGGTGRYFALIAVLNQEGIPVQSGYAYIGDRQIINSLEIVEGRIILDYLTQAPGGQLCCPTEHRLHTYVMDEVLRLVSDQRMD